LRSSDPRELASRVKKIDGYAKATQNHDPTGLVPVVKQIIALNLIHLPVKLAGVWSAR